MYGRQHDEDDQGVKWMFAPGASTGATVVVIGDLTAETAFRFAGAQAVLDLDIRGVDPLGRDDWEQANAVVERYAGWFSHVFYDYCAQVLRTITAGTTVRLPRITPPYEFRPARPPESTSRVTVEGKSH